MALYLESKEKRNLMPVTIEDAVGSAFDGYDVDKSGFIDASKREYIKNLFICGPQHKNKYIFSQTKLCVIMLLCIIIIQICM